MPDPNESTIHLAPSASSDISRSGENPETTVLSKSLLKSKDTDKSELAKSPEKVTKDSGVSPLKQQINQLQSVVSSAINPPPERVIGTMPNPVKVPST